MKYLYAYECEKKSLSSPAELQAAIDGNRREGRRPSYSSSLLGYSASPPAPPALLSPPKMRFPLLAVGPGSAAASPRPSLAARKGQTRGVYVLIFLSEPGLVHGRGGFSAETQIENLGKVGVCLMSHLCGLGRML